MQFEMARTSCPLCKRPVPANSPELTLSTRLCDPCKTMVLTAFRGPDSIAAASAAVVPQNGASVRAQPDAPAPDYAGVGALVSFGGNQSGAAFEHQAQSPMPIEPPDAARFDFYEDKDPIDSVSTVDGDSAAFSEYGTSRPREELSEGFVQTISAIDRDYPETDDLRPTGRASEFTEAALDSHTKAIAVEDLSEEPPSIGEEAVTDPWEAPLPAWDYSHNEWPVLVGPSQRRSFKITKYAIAAVVLLACAAGVYFLIYPSNPKVRTATDTGTTARLSAVESPARAAGPADSDPAAQAAPTRSGTPSGVASQPAESVASEAEASDGITAKGLYSLQAAAFPTQAGADEFAERLKRAGVPSYVVPADISRRGRWFRVRAGRFNSAEEAQRFAGEAQQRARAAGLALLLIVCQYDQP